MKKPLPLHYARLLQSLAKSPSSLAAGAQAHCHLLKAGLDSDRFVGNTLLSFYLLHHHHTSLLLPRRLFDSLPSKDVVTWTSMLSAYVRSRRPLHALRLFVQMSHSDLPPNAFTLSAAVKASASLADLRLGRSFHSLVLLRGFGSSCVISTSLIDMYGRCSALEDARRVLLGIPEPDSVSWTSMVSACARNDSFDEAVAVFYRMVREAGVVPDEFTFGSVLSALGNLGSARAGQGRQAHAWAVAGGLGGNVFVESGVVDMYAKCGLVVDSRRVFDRMPVRNAVSWCALLNGYCQSGDHETALALFREMYREVGDHEHYSFGSVLRACAGLAAVREGKEIHCRYLRTGGSKHVIVESALVDLYAKCGYVDYAHRVFSMISTRNMITWNAMISGLAQNGRGVEAIQMFDDMVREGNRPDCISFIGVLSACSHTGLVEKGREYFRSMSKGFGIKPQTEHYSCMVDLLSRVGLLEEAEDLIESSATHTSDSSLWAALLGACATHSRPAVAERVARKMMELVPGYHLSYVLLANVYRSVGRWSDALEIWRLMRRRGVRKAPGKSWIEIKGNIGSYRSRSDDGSSESQGFEELNLEEGRVICIRSSQTNGFVLCGQIPVP